MHVGGNDLKRAKAVRKNFANQLKAAEANIAKTAVDVKALLKKVESSQKEDKIATLAKEKCVALMTTTVEALKTLKVHADECVETFNAVQTSEQEAKVAVADKEKLYTTMLQTLKKRKSKVEDLDIKTKEMNEKYQRIQHECTIWSEKIKQLMTEFNNDLTLTTRMDEDDEEDEEEEEEDDEEEERKEGDEEVSNKNKKQFLLEEPSVKELDQANVNELETTIDALETKITQLRGEIDMSALEAYNTAHCDWRKLFLLFFSFCFSLFVFFSFCVLCFCSTLSFFGFLLFFFFFPFYSLLFSVSFAHTFCRYASG